LRELDEDDYTTHTKSKIKNNKRGAKDLVVMPVTVTGPAAAAAAAAAAAVLRRMPVMVARFVRMTTVKQERVFVARRGAPALFENNVGAVVAFALVF
jgi:hypothetical protein